MTDNFGQWRADEAARAAVLWQMHFSDHYDHEDAAPPEAKNRALKLLARALGRTFENVFNRLHHYGLTFASSRHRGDVAGATAVQEMEVRRRAHDRQTITGAVFGDPPPGYSALDKRRPGTMGSGASALSIRAPAPNKGQRTEDQCPR